jgi:hypothetical protein
MTGGLIVSLAALRGADVLATAGPASRVQVMEAGAATVVDYHDQTGRGLIPETGERRRLLVRPLPGFEFPRAISPFG